MISFCIILPCITSFHIKEAACPAKQDFSPIFVVLGKYKEKIQEWQTEEQQWLNTCAPPNCRLLEEIWYTLPCDVEMYKLSCTVPLAQRWEAKNSCYPLSHAENMGCSVEDLMFFGLSSSAYPGRGWRWSSGGLGCSNFCISKTGDHVLPSSLVFWLICFIVVTPHDTPVRCE